MIGGYKDYGLTGQTVTIRPKEFMAPSGLLDAHTCDPWKWAEHKARVVQETSYFLTVTILPKYNPHGYGTSKPYRTAIHKHDITTGQVIIRDLTGERVR